MVRAIRLLTAFAIVTIVLHYIGPATRFVLTRTPEVLRVLAAFGAAVEVPF